MATKAKATEISILEIQEGQISVMVMGTTPLICGAMSQKAMQTLLVPPTRKNAAEKAITLKHDPMKEFRDSMYYARKEDSPTRIVYKATCFKKGMMGAALDLPGSSKAQIGRLVWVESDEVSIYGIPQLLMSVVRCADTNRTPDVRSRAIIPEWCCELTIRYAIPILKEQSIVNLLAAAGIMQGLGDWRPEKGSGNYGQYSLVDADDTAFKAIVETGGKAQQDEAIKNPIPYDSETDALLEWYGSEVNRRGFKTVA